MPDVDVFLLIAPAARLPCQTSSNITDPFSFDIIRLQMDVFHLFSACIKGCKLLADAHGMPKEYEYLRHRLKLEELKLLDWWLSHASNATFEVEFSGLQAHQREQTVIESLEQIKSLTFEVGEINERYGLSLQESDDGPDFDAVEPVSVASLIQVCGQLWTMICLID